VDGEKEGVGDGIDDGAQLGSEDGTGLESNEGSTLGEAVGESAGGGIASVKVGLPDGEREGVLVGFIVGREVGRSFSSSGSFGLKPNLPFFVLFFFFILFIPILYLDFFFMPIILFLTFFRLEYCLCNGFLVCLPVPPEGGRTPFLLPILPCESRRFANVATGKNKMRKRMAGLMVEASTFEHQFVPPTSRQQNTSTAKYLPVLARKILFQSVSIILGNK